MHCEFLELRSELEQRYSTLEELQKSAKKYDQQAIEKELESLEKLQNKYNKIEAKRKKLAKQNYDQVRIHPSLFEHYLVFQISKFADAYDTGLSALKSDVNDRSILGTTKEHNESLTKSNTFQSR